MLYTVRKPTLNPAVLKRTTTKDNKSTADGA